MAAGAISELDVVGFIALDAAGIIALYWFVSISLVYINKFIVSGDSLPIFVTWAQVRWTAPSARCHRAGDSLGSRPNVGDGM